MTYFLFCNNSNVQTVIALELLTAAQAVEFLKPLKCGLGINAAYQTIRKTIPPLRRDRILRNDIQKILSLVQSGKILKNVERVVKIL